MTRFTLVAISLGFMACGGNSSATIDALQQNGGEDASAPTGSGGSSNGAGGSSASSGGSAGAVGSGGAVGTGTGGATGTGGTRTGGGGTTGAGGAGTGGAMGTGGAAGTGGGVVVDAGPKDSSGPVDSGPAAECKVDTDCKLSDTCCTCLALGPNDQAPPPCALLCIQSACAAQGIHGVRCSQGQCVIAPECDPRTVTCKLLPEPCPAGQVQSVKGACWGGCVPASACRTVADCKPCEADGFFCARQEAQLASTYRCIDVPPQCDANNSCACAGPVACLPPFSTCSSSNSGRQLNCSCPTC